MLAKLIKYNLKPIIKNILPFMILFISSVGLFVVTSYETEYIFGTGANDSYGVIDTFITASELQQFLHGIASFLISCSLILLFAVSIKAIWQRFKTSFYSDEAYLTHTLPIPRHTLWNAQICTMVIVFVTILAIIVPNCLLLSTTLQGRQVLESFGLINGCTHCVGDYYHVEPLQITTYLSYILVVFAELTFLTLCGISGLIIKNRTGKKIAIISGVGIYLFCSYILLALMFIGSDMLTIFSGTSLNFPGRELDVDFMTGILSRFGLVYLCYCTILYFIDYKLLQHGINLD